MMVDELVMVDELASALIRSVRSPPRTGHGAKNTSFGFFNVNITNLVTQRRIHFCLLI